MHVLPFSGCAWPSASSLVSFLIIAWTIALGWSCAPRQTAKTADKNTVARGTAPPSSFRRVDRGSCDVRPVLPELSVEERHSGQTMVVALGQLIEVRLTENPNTGFAWGEPKLYGPAVEQLGLSRYRKNSLPGGALGVAGHRVAVLRAQREGRCVVELRSCALKGKDRGCVRSFRVVFLVKRCR